MLILQQLYMWSTLLYGFCLGTEGGNSFTSSTQLCTCVLTGRDTSDYRAQGFVCIRARYIVSFECNHLQSGISFIQVQLLVRILTMCDHIHIVSCNQTVLSFAVLSVKRYHIKEKAVGYMRLPHSIHYGTVVQLHFIFSTKHPSLVYKLPQPHAPLQSLYNIVLITYDASLILY